jgi:uncharacterized protein (TIRG00374 family)
MSDLLVLWAILLLVASLVRRRTSVFRDVALATIAAGATALVAVRMMTGDWPDLGGALTASDPPGVVPSLRLAAATAAVITASPHLSRPFRRIGHWLITGAAVGLVIIGATTPGGAIMALLIAGATGAIVHLVFGSSAGRPGLDEVHDALTELGVESTDLAVAERQVAGVYTLQCNDPDGRRLRVLVYGRDAWDTQLLVRIWRVLWYRRTEALSLTRLQQAEHEAFLTLHAANRGVSVPGVVTAGRTVQNDALLVLRWDLEPLGDEIDDATLADMWSIVDSLAVADIAHGDLAPSRFLRDGDGRLVLTGLGGAAVAPIEDQVRADQAQLLVTTALLVGAERALAAAIAHLGAEGLAPVLPYLQTAALGGELRRDGRVDKLDLDDFRKAAAGVAAIEPPSLAKLRRVSLGALIRMALLSLAAYSILSAMGDVDFEELWQELQDATWAWVIVGFLAGQTPRLAQPISTRGASPIPLPYGPVYALQLAISFVNLAIPSTAARVAINVRFFQRQGVPPASAVSIGAIDGFGGFVVQVLILTLTLVLGLGSVELDIDPSSAISSLVNLLVIIVVAAIVVLIVALVVPKLRRWVWAKIEPWVHQVWSTVQNLKSPLKVLEILGGNLLSELLFAATLGIFLEAFGSSTSFANLLVINVTASLFAGLMPIPGGIGVTEGALIAGLTAAGIPSTVAFAAVILYRMATFYLPPIWGAFAFRWLERNKYL